MLPSTYCNCIIIKFLSVTDDETISFDKEARKADEERSSHIAYCQTLKQVMLVW